MQNRVVLISGRVQVTEGRSSVVRSFDMGIVAGVTEEEIRKNFQYYRTFYGKTNEKEREKMREKEREGKIKLLDFRIEKELGLLVPQTAE